MLKDSLYNIISYEAAGDSVKASLAIRRECEIFDGHFPGFPIVPGVCMMQIIKEMLEQKVNRKLQLVTTANMKFINVINPDVNKEVEVEMKLISVDGEVTLGEGVLKLNGNACFKMIKSVYQ